jgi:hypothetical protein
MDGQCFFLDIDVRSQIKEYDIEKTGWFRCYYGWVLKGKLKYV